MYLGGVERRPVSRGDAAAQQTDLVQWGLGVHLCQADVRHHRVLREGAGAHEVEQLLPLAGEAGRVVGHKAPALGHSVGDTT